MDVQFSVNGNIDPIAAYAAILSTFIAVWEWLKWRSKHEIELIGVSTDRPEHISPIVLILLRESSCFFITLRAYYIKLYF